MQYRTDAGSNQEKPRTVLHKLLQTGKKFAGIK